MERLNLIQQISASIAAAGLCMILHVLTNNTADIIEELGFDKLADKFRKT